MPSVSQTQQRLMGMAWAYQKGELSLKDIPKPLQEKIKDLAKNMKKKDLSDFAHTKRKNLPERVTRIVDEIFKMKNVSKIALEILAQNGFVTNIETDTINNENFRKVLFTGKNSQLVLMSIKPGDDIGEETHTVDQFFRVESGSGKLIINNNESTVADGTAFIVPSGAKHNLINSGSSELKLYTIYSPPQHKDKTVHKEKIDAVKSET